MDKSIIYKIWIVEDDVLFKTSLQDLIEDEERLHLSHTAGSVEESIATFEKTPAPDVILQDIGLPGMSGIQAIPLLKKQYPEAFIIMLTIFDDDERIFEAIQVGADGYLLKRTPGEALIKGIWDVLNGGAPISPTIAKKMMHLLKPQHQDINKEERLTKRETTVLQLLVEGLTIDQIGKKLFISRHTVDTHTKNIYRKLQVHNRSTLTAKAIKNRLI